MIFFLVIVRFLLYTYSLYVEMNVTMIHFLFVDVNSYLNFCRTVSLTSETEFRV